MQLLALKLLPTHAKQVFLLSSPTDLTVCNYSESQSLYDSRCTSNQFVLVPSPQAPWDQDHRDSFLQLNPHIKSSLMRRWVYHLWKVFGLLPSVRIAHVACNWIFFRLAYTQVSPVFAKRIMPILHIYNGRFITWTIISLTASKFKPLILCLASPCPIPL
jgi:hypothetical protein